jgi:hypothetical protein
LASRVSGSWLLGPQSRVGHREHVGDRHEEAPLILGGRVAEARGVGAERAEHLVARADGDARAVLHHDRRPAAHRRRRGGRRAGRLFRGAPGGEHDRLARAVGVRLGDHDALGAERHADPLGRLAREVARRDAAQRALAERGHRRLLVGVPAKPPLGLEAIGDVAPDGQEHRAIVVVDDPPAHLADELRPVAAEPVGARREPQRVLELEVQLGVAVVALAHPFRPERGQRAAEQLLLRVAEQLLRERVDVHDRAVPPGADDRVGKTLEQRPE